MVLLPPALAFVAALLLATAMPPLLRAITRRSRRAPLALRLSLLSLSRDTGSAGRDDDAAGVQHRRDRLRDVLVRDAARRHRRRGCLPVRAGLAGPGAGTGLSIAPSVVPVDRYARLGPDVTAVPVFTRPVPRTGRGGRYRRDRPAVLPTLPGWRSDFSATPVTELATRLERRNPPVAGRSRAIVCPPESRMLDVRFRYTGDPSGSMRSSGPTGRAVRMPLGTWSTG